jgi:hypothetical protein
VREAVDVGVERDQALEALQYVRQRPSAEGRAVAVAACVNAGEAEELPCTLVDQEVDGLLGEGDAAFEPGAGFGEVPEVGELERVLGDSVEFADEPARALAHPRDDVEQEESGQESQERRCHGLEYDPSFCPGGSEPVFPTV